MNQKLGGAKAPTGTPSLAWSCVVVVASLLAGASVVHSIYKPNLVSAKRMKGFSALVAWCTNARWDLLAWQQCARTSS